MTPIRILLVDDNEAWLSILRRILHSSPRWQVVGEAHDGDEAILKSRNLHPDVVVLDLDLPKIYGFEAARQIRAVARRCKILFLSGIASSAAAEVALMINANGYILKSEAAAELIPALEAVMEGGTFVSRSLRPSSTETDLT